MSQVPLAAVGDELLWEVEEEEPYHVDDVDQRQAHQLGLRAEPRASAHHQEHAPSVEGEEGVFKLRLAEHARATEEDGLVLRLRGDGEQGEEQVDAPAAGPPPELLALRGKGLRGSPQGVGGDGEQEGRGGAGRSRQHQVLAHESRPASPASPAHPATEGVGMGLRGGGGSQAQEAYMDLPAGRWQQRHLLSLCRQLRHLLACTHALLCWRLLALRARGAKMLR